MFDARGRQKTHASAKRRREEEIGFYFTRRHNMFNPKYSFAPGIHALTFYCSATRESPSFLSSFDRTYLLGEPKERSIGYN